MKKITLLTRKGAARYLGVDPNSISSGRVVGFPHDAVVLTIGHSTGSRRHLFYDADRIVAFADAQRRGSLPDAELRAKVLEAALTVRPGTVVVSGAEIATLHRKPDGSPQDGASVSKWANRGWMPEPLASFDTDAHKAAGTAEQIPPLYSLDAYLAHNQGKRAVDQKAVAALSESHAVGRATTSR
jgi:hypothetical protein